jgi:hypothetical protein
MADFINFGALVYVGFRLAPFILVSFFVLSSLFNSDIKGLIFLAMLLLNCFVTIMLGNMLAPDTFGNPNPNGVCNGLTLTKSGPLSQNLPLNINIMSFTFAYLAYIIYRYDLIMNNIPTVIIFSLFILYNIFWQVQNRCSSFLYSLFSLAIGFGLGWVMSMSIDAAGIVQLQYFNGLTNQEVCKRANNKHFKCTTKAGI